MFKQKRRREQPINTLIGAETRVQGDIEFTGGCLIEGFVKGNVRCWKDDGAMLNISERGCVEGTVVVPNIVLNGTVRGDVAASGRVELGAKARVVGNVRYGLIEMAIGAAVNGKLIHASEAAAGISAGKEAGAVPRVAKVNRMGEGS